MPRITIPEWGRRQVPPITSPASHKRVRVAQIPIGTDGLIDQKDADKRWKANAHPRGKQSSGKARVINPGVPIGTGGPPELTMQSKVNIKLMMARLESEDRKNKLAQGVLVERSKVQAWEAEIFTAIRKSFQSLPIELFTDGYVRVEDQPAVAVLIERKLTLLAEFRP